MFFCVKESELDRLSEFTTRNIAAYALDKSYDRHTNSSGICYEYLADLFPTTDEVNAALQSNKPKKAMLKLAKAYIKKLYNPKDDDPIAYRFNLATLTLLHVASNSSRNIIVFVEPDEVPAQYASYFKYIKVYLNAIIAEFYAEGYVKRKGKKVLPIMLFEHFVPNWLRLGKKESKKICKYFKKAGYDLGKEHTKKLKKKQIAKSVARFARSSELSASGQNLYDMIDLTFNVDFNTTMLCSRNYQDIKKDARKRIAAVLAKKLCLRGNSLIDDLAKNCTKSGKKTIKKLRKRVEKRSKEQIKYYKELVTIFGAGDETGASLNDMAQRKIIKLPKVGKKCAKSDKKYRKVIKAFSSMKAPSLGIIYTHITARCMGAEIGDGEYNRMMSNVIAQLDPSKYREPKQLAKQFVNLAKAYKKAAATQD